MSLHAVDRRRVLLVGAMILFVLGAGCRNPFRKDPVAVLKESQDRSVAATSVREEAALRFELTLPIEEKSEKVRVTVTSAGASAEPSPGDIRTESSGAIAIETVRGDARVTFDSRSIAQTVYLRLNELAASPKGVKATSAAQIDAILGAVKGAIGGKWLKLDPQELLAFARDSGATELPKLPGSAEIPVLQERLRTALRAHQIFVVREDLGDERIDGIRAYHYRVGLNATGLTAIAEQMLPMLGASTEELSEIRKLINDPKVRETIDRASGEVWIAKRNRDRVRVLFPIDATIPDGAPSRITGSMDLRFRDWGKPVSIDVPSDARSLVDLVKELGGGLLAP